MLSLPAVSSSTVWLRSPRFDAWLQAGALIVIAPALILYVGLGTARASALLPLASLMALPFLHVFGSFFFAFSAERNRSASSPRRLAVQWAIWAAAALALHAFAPRALATFALLYGGWHIFRQNFGFLRELAKRDGLAADRALRRLDLAASAAPAVALWLWQTAPGPWQFLEVDVYHAAVPRLLLALAFAAVPITIALRELRIKGAGASSKAGLLLNAGNVVALLLPALLVDDLLLIYTLSATYHGFQYLAYLAACERERSPEQSPTAVLAPLGGAILLSMIVLLAAITGVGWAVGSRANEFLVVVWYAIVPFHYFVDGRIWRRGTAVPIR
jgi:hypothetical protein